MIKFLPFEEKCCAQTILLSVKVKQPVDMFRKCSLSNILQTIRILDIGPGPPPLVPGVNFTRPRVQSILSPYRHPNIQPTAGNVYNGQIYLRQALNVVYEIMTLLTNLMLMAH